MSNHVTGSGWGLGTLDANSHLTDDVLRKISAFWRLGSWRRKMWRAILKIKSLIRLRDGGWMYHNNRRWEADSNATTDFSWGEHIFPNV